MSAVCREVSGLCIDASALRAVVLLSACPWRTLHASPMCILCMHVGHTEE